MIPRLRPEFTLIDLIDPRRTPVVQSLLGELSIPSSRRIVISPSGRAALAAALRAVGAREAIVPAFNCWAVMEALRHADVKPRFVDIGDDLNADPVMALRAIESSPQGAAFVLTHQFGLPQRESARLVAAARRHGLRVIEDGAAALGAVSDAGPVGSVGDLAIFSLQYTKTAIAGDGGVLLFNDSDSAAVAAATERWRGSTALEGARRFAELLAYLILTHPALYGWTLCTVLSSRGTYNQRDAECRPDLFESVPRAFQLRLASRTLRRASRTLAARRRIAERYLDGLAGSAAIVPPTIVAPGAAPIRFPLLVPNRERFVAASKRRGLDLGRSFSYTCSDSGFPGAERVAASIVNLPLSARLEPYVDLILTRARSALHDAT